MPKRGRLSNDEREFILREAPNAAPEDIARRLDRTVETVTDFIRKNFVPQEAKPAPEAEDRRRAERVIIRTELKNSLGWRQLKEEFLPDELKLFEEKYVGMMEQFREDVLATEETQIMQAIKYEILMSRNLKARQRAISDIQRLEKMQEDYLAQFGGDPRAMDDDQKAFVLNLETQLTQAKAAEQSRTNEYVKLQERHADLMKTLKGTRDQRIKAIESSKISFLGVLKELQNKERQEQVGRQMELLHLAGEKEYLRLGRPHRYEDGSEDSPILSPETVDLDPDESESPE